MMPEVVFDVRWPDGAIDACYSPSTVVTEHFEVGRRYLLAEFLTIARTALEAASSRVRQRYGGAGCSRAVAQLAALEAAARRQTADRYVTIEGFHQSAV